MDGYMSKHMRVLFCLIVASAFSNCAGSFCTGGSPIEDKLKAEGLCITLAVNSKQLSYTISVQNISDRQMCVFDDFSESAQHQRFFAGPAKIAIKDMSDNLVSVTPSSLDGWWTSAILSSQGTALPAQLRSLGPHEKIIGTFQLSDLCVQLCPPDVNFAQWIRGKRVRLKVDVKHTDPMLMRSFSVITRWQSF
jgi:hypothetical protein